MIIIFLFICSLPPDELLLMLFSNIPNVFFPQLVVNFPLLQSGELIGFLFTSSFNTNTINTYSLVSPINKCSSKIFHQEDGWEQHSGDGVTGKDSHFLNLKNLKFKPW